MTCAVYRSHKTRFCMHFLYTNYNLYSACVHTVRAAMCEQGYAPVRTYVHMRAHLCTVCATSRCSCSVQLMYTAISTHSRYKYVHEQCVQQCRYLVDLFISWDTVWLVSFVGWICSTYRLTSLTRYEIPHWIHDQWIYSMNERCVHVIAWLPWRKLIKYKNWTEYIRLHKIE